MNRSPAIRAFLGGAVVPGVLAGLAGGIAFGAAMAVRGVLPTVASLIRTDSAVAGFAVHMTIAAIVGAGLGILLRGRWSPGDILFWGVAYASFFWFLGPVTLQPIILARMPTYDVAATQAAFPSLLGHITWGATAALALIALKARRGTRGATTVDREGDRAMTGNEPNPPRDEESGPAGTGVLLRGALAGVLGYAAISLLPAGSARMLSAWVVSDGADAGLGPLALAILAAILFAAFHPRSASTAGAAAVRGVGFGFLVWVIGGLTILPVLRGDGLGWSIEAARGQFPSLPATILFGAAMALVNHWLLRLTRVFFSDERAPGSPDAGSWGLRALARGAAAGVVGGLVFTLVMLQIGYLPTVARLVGSESVLVGLVVHLVIAQIVGASYGLLFRRQAFDPSSAVGWGVSYGFLWWVLGPLTLGPAILGTVPAWTATAAAAAFPGLIGHLAYGAAVGWTFHTLEARYSPWWISRTEREAARMAGRRAEATSAGPALWALLVLVAVALPIILGS